MDMLRVQALWTGFQGAPGYSSFYFAGGGGLISDAGQVVSRVRDALEHLEAPLPTGVSIQISGTVEVIDSDSGQLVGYQDVDQPDPVVGDAAGTSYSAPSGAVVNWLTDDVRFGRRIRGRTFVVPLSSSAYQADGTLTNGALSSLNDFASAMRGWDFDSEFGVFSRPRGGSGGVFATCTGHRVPDMVAVLRSRRD